MMGCAISKPYLYMASAASRCDPQPIHIGYLWSPPSIRSAEFCAALAFFSLAFFKSRQLSSVFFLQSIYPSLPAACASALCICIHNVYCHAPRFFRPENFSQGSCFLGRNHLLPSYPMLLRQDPGTSPPLGAVRTASKPPRVGRDHQSGLGRPCLACPADPPSSCQTLKERFAELLPEKIDEIKTLRKSVTKSPPVWSCFMRI